MTKAQEMLAKAGLPDTKQGRAAFHKMYPTPDDFFKVHGNIFKDFPELVPMKLPIKPENVTLNHSPDREYYLSNLDTSDTSDKNTYRRGGPVMYGDGGGNNGQQLIYSSETDPNFKPYTLPPFHIYSTSTNHTLQEGKNYQNTFQNAATNINLNNGNTSQQFTRQSKGNPNQTYYVGYYNSPTLGSQMEIAGDNGNKTFFTPDPMMDNFLKTRSNYLSGAMAGEQMKRNGGTVDAYQLMGMPTPEMYGPGSTVHPTLTLSTEQNPNPSFQPSYSNNPFYNHPYSVNNRTTLAGTLPISKSFNLTGSYSDANDGTYTAGAELNVGDILSGAGGKGPSRKYDNPDIAHKGSNSFLDSYGHARLGVTNDKTGKVVPYWGFDIAGVHQMGRVKGPNGLRQPKGTIYASGEFNHVEDPANSMFENNNYLRANLGGSYNFGKGLGVYGEAGYDFMRNSPRAEVGLKKTFADGGYIPSYNFGHVLSKNNTHMHGYANGGPVGMYGFGSTIKDLGYGLVDTQLSTIGGLTGIQSMQDIVDEDQYSNDKFDNVANFGGKAVSTAANFIPGAQPFLAATRGIGELANTTFKIDEKNYDPSQHTSNWDKWGNIVGQVGNTVAMFTNPASAASSLSKGAKTAMNVGKIAGLGATAVKAGQDIDKSRGGTYDPTNALNLGMGIAKSGFFGGNTNTSSNFGNNTKGAADYTPIVDGPLYAAMGGAVNAPNMMKYAQGGMTPPPIDESMQGAPQGNGMTEINVEHGELLTDPNGNIVTEYGSNALPPHPADGSMDDKGTVNAPEGYFVVKKNLAEKYKAAMKNNDKLHADAMRNNIAFDKQRKEAKEQAMQEAMAQQTMMARNEGMIRKFDGGSWTPYTPPSIPTPPYIPPGGYLPYIQDSNNSPTWSPYKPPTVSLPSPPPYNTPGGINPNQPPYAQEPGDVDWGTQPRIYNASDITGVQPAQPAPPPPPYMRHYGLYPNEFPYQQEEGENWDNKQPWSPYKLPTVPNPNTGYGDTQGDYPNTIPYRVEEGENWGGVTNYNKPKTPGEFDPNYFNLQRGLGYASPAILGMEALFSKAFKMNPEDYQIKGKIDPYEEQYRPDYRPYNAAVANLNRMPGSGNLAARTNLFNAMQQQQDDARYKISLANAQRKMAAQQANLGIEGQNLSTAMNIAQFNEQNKANRRNAIREQFGKNLPAVAYNDMANQMAMAGMSAAYPEYNFPWNKKRGV